MVEAWFVEPYVGTALHQLVYGVKDNVGGEGHVALGGDHDLDIDASCDGAFQSVFY